MYSVVILTQTLSPKGGFHIALLLAYSKLLLHGMAQYHNHFHPHTVTPQKTSPKSTVVLKVETDSQTRISLFPPVTRISINLQISTLFISLNHPHIELTCLPRSPLLSFKSRCKLQILYQLQRILSTEGLTEPL
jgi:hypothetical protein